MKKLLSLVLCLIMVLSLLAFASCEKTETEESSKESTSSTQNNNNGDDANQQKPKYDLEVLNLMDDIENADSYTYESVRFDKDGKQTGTKTITKVDFKNLAVHSVRVNDQGETTSDTYYYFDKDAEKYYSASVDAEGKVVSKTELKEKDFYEKALDYIVSSNSTHYEKALDWGIYKEIDGALVSETVAEKDGDYGDKTTLKVEDKAVIGEFENTYKANGEVEVIYSSVFTYYDINNTEIEIPQAVLDAMAAEVKE